MHNNRNAHEGELIRFRFDHIKLSFGFSDCPFFESFFSHTRFPHAHLLSHSDLSKSNSASWTAMHASTLGPCCRLFGCVRLLHKKIDVVQSVLALQRHRAREEFGGAISESLRRTNGSVHSKPHTPCPHTLHGDNKGQSALKEAISEEHAHRREPLEQFQFAFARSRSFGFEHTHPNHGNNTLHQQIKLTTVIVNTQKIASIPLPTNGAQARVINSLITYLCSRWMALDSHCSTFI